MARSVPTGTTTGVRIVFNHFPDVVIGLGNVNDQDVEQIAEAVADTARSLAPVDTGNLLGGIEAHAEGRGHWQVTSDPQAADGSGYGSHVEMGTHDHGAAQPYMRPAAYFHELDLPKAVMTMIDRETGGAL